MTETVDQAQARPPRTLADIIGERHHRAAAGAACTGAKSRVRMTVWEADTEPPSAAGLG